MQSYIHAYVSLISPCTKYKHHTGSLATLPYIEPKDGCGNNNSEQNLQYFRNNNHQETETTL